MVIYIVLQTLVLSIASGFIAYGSYCCPVDRSKRKKHLYHNIGIIIILIFVLDVIAYLIIK